MRYDNFYDSSYGPCGNFCVPFPFSFHVKRLVEKNKQKNQKTKTKSHVQRRKCKSHIQNMINILGVLVFLIYIWNQKDTLDLRDE